MNKRRPFLSIILVLTFTLSCAFTSQAATKWPAAPGIASDAGIIMDANTGTILYQKNIDTVLFPASITKIMTCLVALDNSKLDEVVTFSRDAVYNIEYGSNHIGVQEGEELTMEECLHGMLLESANEVCNGVAEHVGGSYDKFIEMMNAKAAELGCSHTHFTNPNGLHDSDHYSSARDMALIMKACLKNEDFRRIAGTRAYQMPPTNMTEDVRYLNNQHKMFPNRTNAYEGFECGKTGFTNEAMNTLVTAAKRDDIELICVTMHGHLTHYSDTAILLDYGFKNFHNEVIATADSSIADKSFVADSTALSDFVKDASDYTVEFDQSAHCIVPDNVSIADFTKRVEDISSDGSTLKAKLAYYYGEDLMGSADFTVTKPKSVSSEVDSIKKNHPIIFSILKIIIIIILILVLGYISLFIYAKFFYKKKKRKRRNNRRRR